MLRAVEVKLSHQSELNIVPSILAYNIILLNPFDKTHHNHLTRIYPYGFYFPSGLSQEFLSFTVQLNLIN